ncbi:MAG: ADP-ribosylglycohydrolase family protein [Candidatus Alkanophagales archaeon]
MLRCLLSLAVGDALGSPVEGLTQEEILRRYGKIKDFLSGAETTDDTLLALLTAEALVEARGVDRRRIAQKLLESRARLRRIGPSTAAALRRLERDINSIATAGATNGAAVRAVPVALCSAPENLLRNVVEATLVTHGADVAVSGACAVAFAVRAAVSARASGVASLRREKDEILEASREGARLGRRFGTRTAFPRIDEVIEEAVATPLRRLPAEVGVGVYAHESVPAAISAFYQTGDLKSAIVEAVNLGGDADTIAALCGAIAGAFYKRGRLPLRWVLRIEERKRLKLLERKLLRMKA